MQGTPGEELSRLERQLAALQDRIERLEAALAATGRQAAPMPPGASNVEAHPAAEAARAASAMDAGPVTQRPQRPLGSVQPPPLPSEVRAQQAASIGPQAPPPAAASAAAAPGGEKNGRPTQGALDLAALAEAADLVAAPSMPSQAAKPSPAGQPPAGLGASPSAGLRASPSTALGASPSTSLRASDADRPNLEQRVGASWLNKVGIVVLILAAVFFNQYAYQQGWINESMRVAIVALVGLGLLAAGEWTYRRAMRIFAAGATGGGVAMLYLAVYLAGPRMYQLLPPPHSFVATCAVSLIGVLLSLRAGKMATAILVQVGAYLSPWLLSTGKNEQVVLMGYLLAAGAGFLLVSALKRWWVLAPLALVGTVGLFAGWFALYYADVGSQWLLTSACAWGLYLLFLAYGVYTAPAGQRRPVGVGVAAAASAAMAVLLMRMSLVAHNGLVQLMILDGLLLAACLWCRWGKVLIAATAGAYLVPLGLMTARGDQTALMIYLLATGAAYLLATGLLGRRFSRPGPSQGAIEERTAANSAAVAPKDIRWQVLPLIAAGGAILVFGAWLLRFGPWDQYRGWSWDDSLVASIWAWAIFAMFMVYVLHASLRAMPAAARYVAIAIVGALAAAMALLWLAMIPGDGKDLAQLLTLAGVILAAGLLCRWNWLRLATAAGAAGYLLLIWAAPWEGIPANAGREVWLCQWIWAFFGLFTADVLVRAWWRSRGTWEGLDATIASLVTALMFGATYLLLRGAYDNWMGLYTACLAAGTIALSIVLWKASGRMALAQAYFVQGLVLVTLAMPIQFHRSSITLAWAAQAGACMVLGRIRRNRTLCGAALAALGLGILHYAGAMVPDPGWLSEAAWSPLGVELSWLLLLGALLSAAALACAAVLRQDKPFGLAQDKPLGLVWGKLFGLTQGKPVELSQGKPVFGEKADYGIAVCLVWGGAALWCWRTAASLPAVTTTWWWWAMAIVPAAVGLRRRSAWLVYTGAALLVLTAGQFMLIACAVPWSEGTLDVGAATGLNWQFAIAVALAVAILLFGVAVKRLARADMLRQMRTPAILVAAFLVLLAGSVEIARHFSRAAWASRADVEQYRQACHSVWWSVYAAGLLIAGFAGRYAPVRYMSLAIFAGVVGKAFLVDLAHVEVAYRIVSFFALGVVLLGASYLYQRHLRAAVAAREATEEGK